MHSQPGVGLPVSVPVKAVLPRGGHAQDVRVAVLTQHESASNNSSGLKARLTGISPEYDNMLRESVFTLLRGRI